MKHKEIADRTGLTLADLEWLLDGRASANVAERFGVTMADVESFIRGEACAGITKRLGFTTMSVAMELGTVAGPKFASGVLVGLLLTMQPGTPVSAK